MKEESEGEKAMAVEQMDLDLEKQTTAQRLATLELLTAKIAKILLQERAPIDATIFISSTRGWNADYHERKHLYIFSASSQLLSLQDLGSFLVPANVWTLFDPPAGCRVFAPNESTPVPFLIRASDDLFLTVSGDVPGKGDYLEYANLSAAALNALILPVTDVSAYKSFSITVSGTWNGQIVCEGSNDGANWENVTVYSIYVVNGGTTHISANSTYAAGIAFRYLRVRVSTYNSGTIDAVVELYTYPVTPAFVVLGSSGVTIGNVNLNAGTATIGGINNDGTQTTAIAAGAAADTVVKASAGRLAAVLVTATGTNAMLIFDNASGHTGTIIGYIPANATVGTIVVFKMPAANGITVQGNAANPGVTISWV